MHKRRPSLLLLTVILICAVAGIAMAIPDSEQYVRWQKLTSAELMKRGAAFEKDGEHDKALTCYSIVEDRWSADMSRAETEQCVEAIIKKWAICYYRYYDYASALECLTRAEEIVGESGLKIPYVSMQLGIFYHNIHEQYGDTDAGRLAYSYYKTGFADAVATRDEYLDIIASNLFELANQIDSLGNLTGEIETYRGLKPEKETPKRIYNLRMLDGMLKFREGQPDAAASIFRSLAASAPADGNMLRYKLMAHLNLGRVLKAEGKFGPAVSQLKEAVAIAERDSIKDMQIAFYDVIAACLRAQGDPVGALEYDNRALRLKNELVNFSDLTRVNSRQTARKIDRLQQHVKDMETRRRQHLFIIAVAVAFMIVLLVFALILFNRNRRLGESNSKLYGRTVDMLRQSQQEGDARREFERQIEELNRRLSEAEKPVEAEDAVKYRRSSLDDSQKIALMNTIMSVMENTSEYLNPDFSVERLAELAGSRQKHVSQVINEKRGCNFNTFVNEFRVGEACRRISDAGAYGHLTLDAISQEVGFRSRSTFVNAFKQITGLTPSNYLKIARKGK